jgi:hypothetical protein
MRLAALRAGAAAAEAAERTRDEAQRAERAAAQAVLRHDELRESIASATEDAARWRGDAEELRDPPEVEPPAIGGPAVAAAERAERAAAERERKVEAVLGEKPAPPERPTLVAVPEPGAWARVAQIADALAVRVRGEDTAELVRELGDLAESEGGMKRAKAAAAANAKATKAYDAAVAVSDKWAARLKAAQEAAQEARRAATDARQKQLAASAGKAEAYENAVARRAAVVDANAQKRKRLLAQAADAEGSVKGWQQQIDAEAAAHREAIARLAGVDAVAPATPHAAGDIEALEQEQAQIDRLREDVEGSDARRREMEVLVAEIEATEAEGKVYAAVEWALGRLRERDVANRGAPLLDTMRAFLRHAGREEEPYLRATKAATEFGWRTKAGAEVALEALSGGETVLFTTALAAAVVSLRAPELRVLIVEAAELGSNGAQHAAMLGLTAVELDNALLATCAPVDPPAGWNAVYFAAGGGQPITGRTVR